MQAGSLVRVMVAEDAEAFRRLVCLRLQQTPGLQVICEVSDGQSAIQKAKDLKPDLILLDIAMPEVSGIEAARRILEFAPETRIIFLTQQTSPEFVQEAMRLDARGYVFKMKAKGQLAACDRRCPVRRAVRQ